MSCHHTYRCNCLLKFSLSYDDKNILEFLDDETKTKTIIEFECEIKWLCIINSNILVIITHENAIKYYTVTQDTTHNFMVEHIQDDVDIIKIVNLKGLHTKKAH